MELKNYQKKTMRDLASYLEFLNSTHNMIKAYERHWTAQDVRVGFGGVPPYNDTIPGTPHVCFKVPTGGGKTFMACASARQIFDAMPKDKLRVIVWLVPSNAILEQTTKTLSDVTHPYRQRLDYDFAGRVVVYTKEQLLSGQNFSPTAVREQLSICILSYDSLRSSKKDGRKVYQENSQLAPFTKTFTTPETLIEDVDDTALIQVLNQLSPVVIVDESHNAQSDLSVEMLNNLNPSFVLDLTATPKSNSNIISYVDARELKTENMVKLPVIVYNRTSRQSVIQDAIQLRGSLESQALEEEAVGGSYIRPIVLFQAQNAGDEMPPEKLRSYLINELKLPEAQVVVATGTTRGLEDLDLAARDCPVRFIVTVQALREGWDCPFAYVLCSLQKLSSATAVEQLLGRVLRMPYAQRRGREALNRAYAHVCAAEFSAAAHALADRLIHHMGFEALDVASMIAQPATLPLFGGDELESNKPPALMQQALIATNFEALQATPELLALPNVQIKTIAGAEQVVVAGHIGQEAEALMLAQVRGPKKQEQLREQVAQHNALVAAQLAPAARGVPFAPLPTLAYREDAQAPLWPLEREAVLEAVELDLLTPQAVQLPGFHVVQESDVFEISLSAEARVTLRRTDVDQMAMDYGSSSISAEDLVRWLDQSLFKQLHELTQSQRRAYLAAVVNDQLHRCGVPLVVLAQARFQLAQSITTHFGDLRDAAAKQQFRQLVLQAGSQGAWLVEPDWAHPHVFEPGRYPAPVLSRYAGRYQFGKNYFPVLADLKDGGEEFGCAQLLDRHPQVKHWVRNLDTAPCGFGLPTSRGRFYADFVAELVDGRVALLEYKGAHLLNDPYEIEKSQVGALWAQTSAGRAVFGWLTKQQGGKTLAQQLDAVLA